MLVANSIKPLATNMGNTDMRTRSRYTNKTSYGYKLKTMDNDTYALRRKVMNIIYQIKNSGYDIPRIEVRIVSETTDTQKEVCGYAYLSENVVHIAEKYAKADDDMLTHLVLHEVVHAVTGFRHDDKCYLMNPYIPMNPNPKRSWKSFSKYLG